MADDVTSPTSRPLRRTDPLWWLGVICSVLPFLLLALMQVRRHWFPVGDNAALASRAWRSLPPHLELLGPFSLLSAFNAPTSVGPAPVYGVSPLYFWALSVPVRLDPTSGLMWGAAVIGSGACLMGFISLQSVGLRKMSLLLPLCLSFLMWRAPLVFSDLPWNAYLPVIVFVGALAVGVAVGMGNVRWWPCLVLLGSLAAACHFVFTVPSVAVVFGALGVGWSRRPQQTSRRVLVSGSLIGIALWSPAFVSSRGRHNLSSLLEVQSHLSTLGWRFGLGELAKTVWGPPLALQPAPAVAYVVHVASSPHVTVGGLILVVTASISWWAHRRAHRELFAYGAVLLASQLGFVIGFSQYPDDPFALLTSMWYSEPIWHVLSFAFVVLVLASLGTVVRDRLHSREDGITVPRLFTPVFFVLSVALCVTSFLPVKASRDTDESFIGTRREARLALEIASQIQQRLAPGDVAVNFQLTGKAPSMFAAVGPSYIIHALTYRLITMGYTPEINGKSLEGMSIAAFANWNPVIKDAPLFDVRYNGKWISVSQSQ